ncbi:magnesium transporter, partial [Enterococcus faecium]
MIDLSSNHQERIEKRLEPDTFILSKGLMITYVSRE